MWKVESAYLDGIKFKIRIAKHDPAYHFIVAYFDEDLRGLSDDELINRALDSFFAANYVEKFAKETSERVDQINMKLTEVDAFLTKAKADFQAITEASEMSQGTLVELGEMVFGYEEKIKVLEDRVYALENRNSFGD